jgi:hypothetical protein
MYRVDHLLTDWRQAGCVFAREKKKRGGGKVRHERNLVYLICSPLRSVYHLSATTVEMASNNAGRA